MSRWLVTTCLLVAACGGTALRPAEVGLGADTCAHCRMTIVSLTTAAQIVGRGRDRIMFDELACVRDYLAANAPSDDAVIFVADHRTGEWIEARAAIFTRTGEQTPMASGIVAHADRESRDADQAARGGAPVSAAVILGAWVHGKAP